MLYFGSDGSVWWFGHQFISERFVYGIIMFYTVGQVLINSKLHGNHQPIIGRLYNRFYFHIREGMWRK